MKKLLLSSLLSTAAMFASTTVTLTNIPSTAAKIDGIEVSPYSISVNGNTMQAMCVDPFDFVSKNESWNANLSTVGGDISKTYRPTEAVQYEEATYLYNQITQSGITAQQQIDLQKAVWTIVTPGYQNNSSFLGFGKTEWAPDAASDAYVADAQAKYNTSGIDFSKYQIISSVDMNHKVQEFMVGPNVAPTPEPASCAMLGGGLAILGGALRFFRRKRSDA